jgi:putative flippase GtrA
MRTSICRICLQKQYHEKRSNATVSTPALGLCYSFSVFTIDTAIVSLIAAATAALLVPILLSIGVLPFPPTLSNTLIWIATFIILENAGLLIARLLAMRWKFFMKLARFTSTGVFNTAFDTCIITTLAFLFGVYAGPLLALFNIISFSATTIVSYFINRNWSFASDRSASIREFSSFAGVTISSMLINTALVYFFTTHVGTPSNITPVQWIAIVKILGVFVSFTWNFSWYQFVIFRKKSVLPPTDSDHA